MLTPPNTWIIAAASAELDTGLLGRCLYDEAVLLYRTESGTVVAMADRCRHRRYPLSLGTRDGDRVVCGYHGFTYDTDGVCVAVPGRNRIPSTTCVPTFPVHEIGGWVYVWLGDAAPGATPTVDTFAEGEWVSVGGYEHVRSPVELDLENLHDLSHATFIHPTTIGSSAFAQMPYDTIEEEGRLITRRIWENTDCPPSYERSTGLRSPVDRIIESTYYPPCLAIFDSRIRRAGASDDESFRLVHDIAIVPETAESHHMIWRSSRNYALDDENVSKTVFETETQVLGEDIAVLEAQWHNIRNDRSGLQQVNIKSDAAGLRALRLLQATTGSGT